MSESRTNTTSKSESNLQSTTLPVDNNVAFAFVSELAREVSGGRIELPSCPDVAVRVRKVLADENVSNEQIARVVSSDAGLAARVFTLANSAALSRGGRPVTDMKTAVNRIGHNNVRTAAVSFAIAQLRRANELKHISQELEQLWHEATLTAALAHAVASRSQGISPDEAMLAGLMHNVGKIYVLARAHRFEALFKDKAALAQVMRDWHANIGRAIVENWAFPEHISNAIGDQEDIERSVEKGDLTDVLIVAVMMSTFMGQTADMELNMQGVQSFWRLQLNNDKCKYIMNDCAEEISALRSALGD
jgi:HD-like signal output (HDOD) protein